MQGDDTFSEGDGTVQCCFAISGLPLGGLGCDIVVTVQSLAVGGAMDASMYWTFIVILCLIFCFFLTAAVGSDYALLMTTATFESGATLNGDIQCIQIEITEDDIYEEDEVFIFQISSVMPSSAAVIGSPMQVTKTIQDNGGKNNLDLLSGVFSRESFGTNSQLWRSWLFVCLKPKLEQRGSQRTMYSR